MSLIRITKIFSKDGKLISQAEPQKKLTKEIVKGEKERENQILEAKKSKIQEKQKIKKTLKKMMLKEKKTDENIEKKIIKKKPLTKKK